jgi:hypothetical protein
MKKRRQPFFKLLVQRSGSRQETRGPGTHSPAARGVNRCLDETGMLRESQIVVGAPQDHATPVDGRGHAINGFKGGERPQELLLLQAGEL